MPDIKKLSLFANQASTSPSIPQTPKETKQTSPLSSNGLTFTYNQEENPVYERVGFVRKNSIIHTIQGQPAPLVSPPENPNLDTYNRIISALEKERKFKHDTSAFPRKSRCIKLEFPGRFF